MAEASGIQVASQSMVFTTIGLPGAPAIQVKPIASQAGHTAEFFTNTGVQAASVDVNGAWNGRVNIISGVGATRTLLATESGSTVLFDRAAGNLYTLPAPVVGLWYKFVVTVTPTSNNAEVDTDAGTTFLQGAVEILTSASAVTFGAYANGTSTVKIQCNGTTKGGILGTEFTLVCVTATQWQISGILAGSGSEATPFA